MWQEVVHEMLRKEGLLPAPFFIHGYAHKCVSTPSQPTESVIFDTRS